MIRRPSINSRAISRDFVGAAGAAGAALVVASCAPLRLGSQRDYDLVIRGSRHTSLDASVAQSAGWIAAQHADNRFIFNYARDYPTREDVAESVLPWLMIHYRPERISQALADTIKATMPHRIAFFDPLALNMLPIH